MHCIWYAYIIAQKNLPSPARLLSLFDRLFPPHLLSTWLAASHLTFYQRAFTPLITLWYFVFQRLSHNHTLDYALVDALDGGADRLSARGKPLSLRLKSHSTASLSDARQRLPLTLFEQALRHVASSIGSVFSQAGDSLKVAVIDGTTFRLRPRGNIDAKFPPHRTLQKHPYWCLARAVVLFCAATGAALDAAVDGCGVSEQALSRLIFARGWKGWIIVGDRNFGVYSVIRAAVSAQAQVLLRLTACRAGKLAREAKARGKKRVDVPCAWARSSHDRCPDQMSREPVSGRLICVLLVRKGFRPFVLHLFTTLIDNQAYPVDELVRLYGKRWSVELCLRHLKADMDLGFLECQSAEIAHKEWLAGLIAYNLVRWVMGAAALTTSLALERISFTRTRNLLVSFCVPNQSRALRLRRWRLLLRSICKALLPRRKKPRPAEPRAKRHFRSDVPHLRGSRALARQKLAAALLKS